MARELDLDDVTAAMGLHRSVERGAIPIDYLHRGGARRLARGRQREHATDVWRFPPVLGRRESRDICVGHGCCRRFDGGFADALIAVTLQDALLAETKSGYRDRADRQDENGEEQGLATIVSQSRDHSIRREALAVTMNWGRPTKPKGMGIA